MDKPHVFLAEIFCNEKFIGIVEFESWAEIALSSKAKLTYARENSLKSLEGISVGEIARMD